MRFLRARIWPSQLLTRQCRVLPQRNPFRASLPRFCASCDAPKEAKSDASDASPREPKPDAPDHRVLGLQQELFLTSIYSPGSPILLPNGARIFNRLLDFLRKQYVRYGFQEVITPTIYKKALWATSGHLENYADDMYTVTGASHSHDEATEGGEGEEYGLKPMNCPGHCLIFASKKRSYRDLPIRYADFSPLHRNEISGALSGLTRVRRFHQDDGHIFCRPSQIADEVSKTLDFVRLSYGVLGLGPYRLVLSTRPEKYIGSEVEWEEAEKALKKALHGSGNPFTVNEGDGAFYGPKIDIILKDSDGKEHQTATIQLDFQLPKRFNLEYMAPAPQLEIRGETTNDPELLAEYGLVRPVLIHRAVLGSAERLMALLIERYNGKWPFWLNPRQAVIITVNDQEHVLEWARQMHRLFLGLPDDHQPPSYNHGYAPTGLAIDFDDSPRTVGAKVAEAKAKGYGLIITIGPRDVAAKTVSVNASALSTDAGDSQQRTGGMERRTSSMAPEEALQFMLDKVNTYQ